MTDKSTLKYGHPKDSTLSTHDMEGIRLYQQPLNATYQTGLQRFRSHTQCMVNQSSRDSARESEKTFMGALMKLCNGGEKEMRKTDNT